jgi:hypothetical protein
VIWFILWNVLFWKVVIWVVDSAVTGIVNGVVLLEALLGVSLNEFTVRTVEFFGTLASRTSIVKKKW